MWALSFASTICWIGRLWPTACLSHFCQNFIDHSCVGFSLLLYPKPLVCVFLSQYWIVFIMALCSGIGICICVLSPECSNLNVYFFLPHFLYRVISSTMAFFLYVNTMYFAHIHYSITNRFSHIPSLVPFLFQFSPYAFIPCMCGCDCVITHTHTLYIYKSRFCIWQKTARKKDAHVSMVCWFSLWWIYPGVL